MPDKLETGWAVPTGKSLLEVIWEELDSIVDKLHSEWSREPDEGDDDEWMEYGEIRGQAQGLAYALAVLTTPYAPDVDAIREQAMERAALREETGKSTPKPSRKWDRDDVAYHRGRKVYIRSVGREFAHVSLGTGVSAKFNVPIHELVTEAEEHGPAGPH